jgi:tetratricopeptide (TPR) repeat protein
LAIFLADLVPSATEELRHSIGCPRCGAAAAQVLLDLASGEGKGLVVGQITVEQVLAHFNQRAAAAEEAAARLVELERMPHGERLRALTDGRFRSMEVLEALLSHSRFRLVEEPRLALEFASVAGALAVRLFGCEEEELFAEDLIAASSLGGSAHRHLGQLAEAEEEFLKGCRAAGLNATEADGVQHAELLQGLGLLRWEEGRILESEVYLRQAHRIFLDSGLVSDAADCSLLIGLLAIECGRDLTAARLLRAGLMVLEREESEVRPWLLVSAGLGLAVALAHRGRLVDAEEARRVAEDQMSVVRSEAQIVRLKWEGARAAAALGELQAAENVLRGIRLRLLQERSPDAFLCSWDLGLVIKKLGERFSVLPLLEADLVRTFPEQREAQQVFVALLEETQVDDLASVARGGAVLRKRLRAMGLRIEPLPFG